MLKRKELEEARKVLEKELATTRPARVPEELTEETRRSGNSDQNLDSAQMAQTTDVVVRTLEIKYHRRREIEKAIARVHEGTYGMCAQCDQEIPEKRRKAVPWAEYCITCQEWLIANANVTPAAEVEAAAGLTAA